MRTLTLSATTLLVLSACNQAPEGLQISIAPEGPLTSDDIMMTVDAQPVDPNSGDNVSLEITWSKDSEVRPEYTTPTVPSSATSKGEVWEVRVRAFDDKDYGPPLTASVTVLNAPPSATVELGPEDPASDDELSAITTTDDLDGDPVKLSYSWSVDGTVAPDLTGPTVPGDKTRAGETWEVTVTPNDDEDVGDEVVDSVVIQNTPPIADVVVLRPSEAYEDTKLEASATGSDVDGDELTWTYTWFVSGGEVKSGGDDWLDGKHFSKGDNVLVEAVANDGSEDSEPVLSESVEVLNTPPTVDSATLTPIEATEETVLTCAGSGGFDLDGDEVKLSTTWTVDGRVVSATASTLDGEHFSKGQEVKCSVIPNDGEADGAAVSSKVVTIGNTAPSLASAAITPGSADRNATLKVSLGAVTDIDDDRVELRLDWTVNGSSVSTGSTLAGAFKKGDKVGVTVTPYDGEDLGKPVVAAPITIKNAPPSITTVSISPSLAYTNTTISASSTATDPDGDKLTTSWRWTVNGTTTGGSGTSLAGSNFKKGQRVQAFATVTDGTDTAGPKGSNVVTVRNTKPTPPTIAIDPPAPKTENNLFCDVTKAGTDLDGDRLTYSIDWERNGVTWTGSTTTNDNKGDTILASSTAGSDKWQCFAVSNDGSEDSAEASSAIVTVTASWTPPKVGTFGTAGRISGANWKVCRADTKTAWVAANTGGTYNTITACQSLGYTGANARGGTCGTVCGYCRTMGREYYDGGGGSYTSLRHTVHWRCYK